MQRDNLNDRLLVSVDGGVRRRRDRAHLEKGSEMEMHDHDRKSYAKRLGLPPGYKMRTVAKPCDMHAVLMNVSRTVEVKRLA